MPDDIIDIQASEEMTVSCIRCGQKNRLRSRVSRGRFRCGVCGKIIPNPFISSSQNKRNKWISKIFWIVGIFIITIVLCFLLGEIYNSMSNSKLVESESSYTPVPAPEKQSYAAVSRPAENGDPTQSPAMPDSSPILSITRIPENTQSTVGNFASSATSGNDMDQTDFYRIAPPSIPLERAEIPPPASGTVRNYTGRSPADPLVIVTSFGTNYFLRLRDWTTDNIAMEIFVRGGDTVTVSVPLGSYVLKYATGVKWYGRPDFFGPNTSYTLAKSRFDFAGDVTYYSEITVTLYPVENGNLKTTPITKEEF